MRTANSRTKWGGHVSSFSFFFWRAALREWNLIKRLQWGNRWVMAECWSHSECRPSFSCEHRPQSISRLTTSSRGRAQRKYTLSAMGMRERKWKIKRAKSGCSMTLVAHVAVLHKPINPAPHSWFITIRYSVVDAVNASLHNAMQI